MRLTVSHRNPLLKSSLDFLGAMNLLLINLQFGEHPADTYNDTATSDMMCNAYLMTVINIYSIVFHGPASRQPEAIIVPVRNVNGQKRVELHEGIVTLLVPFPGL